MPLQINFNLNVSLTIRFAIANPDVPKFLPVVAVFMDREPRSCHKVHSFESQPRPEVVEPDPFHGPAGDQWLNVVGLHFKHVPPVKRNRCR